jgi:hypothetical protein
MDKVVVLPAPLPPNKAVVDPRAISKLTLSTARIPSKRLLTPETVTALLLMGDEINAPQAGLSAF